MLPNNDLTGLTFGTLTVLSLREKRGHSRSLSWVVVCSVCNVTGFKESSRLRSGYINCAICELEKAISAPRRALYGNYKDRAKKRNLEFSIDYDIFVKLIHNPCHYCGILNSCYWKAKNNVGFPLSYNGIDRQDNSLGYTTNNCVTCCKFCNLAKSRWPLKEFETWLTHVRSGGRVESNTTEGEAR